MSTNRITLVASRDGKAQNVSVYTGRAEVTRRFRFRAEEGQNQVVISRMPSVLERESLRVDGRGFVTIQEVSISDQPHEEVEVTGLNELDVKRYMVQQSLDRNNVSSQCLKSFMDSFATDTKDPSKLSEAVDQFEVIGKKIDQERIELKKEMTQIQIETQNGRNERFGLDKLKLRVVIGMFAETKGEVELILTYAVRSANWEAIYDIRAATTEGEQGSITLDYKARIVQNTGEPWENVSLILDTATPSFESTIPKLFPWTIHDSSQQFPTIFAHAPSDSSRRRRSRSRSRSRSPPYAVIMNRRGRSRSVSPVINLPDIGHRRAEVLSDAPKGVSSVFTIPGSVTIPDDGQAHTLTITTLILEADLEWVCVPKMNAKIFLNAKIKNASEYTLISGKANVHVDGSFVSSAVVPLVSSHHKFECTLGLDPSIRVTYHPRIKKASQSGTFLSKKTSAQLYSQQITVENTKSASVPRVKICDQIPVSEDEKIMVRLLSPDLPIPKTRKEEKEKTKDKERGGISLSRSESSRLSVSGIKSFLKTDSSSTLANSKDKTSFKAEWDSADPTLEDTGDDLGKDGKMNFVCSLAPKSSVKLLLEWEVSYPVGMKLSGMM